MKLSILVAFFAVVNGHNWMVSPTRAKTASPKFPCVPRNSPKPHIQVAQGQKFELEWATGHSGNSYHVLISAANEYLLSRHSSALLDDYIANAPDASATTPPATIATGRKGHRHLTTTMGCGIPQAGNPTGNCPNDFLNGAAMSLTDPQYIGIQPYPNNAGNALGPMPGTVVKNISYPLINNRQYIWQYQDVNVTTDRYVSYNSAKYPWIISVMRAAHTANRPDGVDFGLFKIPTGSPAGNYVSHWLWQGYYDCTDIQLFDQTAPIQFPYGTVPINGATQTITRIDHCFYNNTQYNFLPAYEVAYDAYSCITKCGGMTKSTTGVCDGVNVFPVILPLNVASGNNQFLSVQRNDLYNLLNSSYIYTGSFPSRNVLGKDIMGSPNTSYTGPHPEYQLVLDSLWAQVNEKAQANPKMMMCLPVHSQVIPNDNSLSKYATTVDPDHPYFYSTCYDFQPSFDFLGFNSSNGIPPAAASASWRNSANCVSCNDLADNGVYGVPFWQTQKTCQNCDILHTEFNISAPITHLKPAITKLNLAFNLTALNLASSQCLKTILPAGMFDFSNPQSIDQNLFPFALQSGGVSGFNSTFHFVATPAECAYFILNDPSCTPYAYMDTSLDQSKVTAPFTTGLQTGFKCQCYTTTSGCPSPPTFANVTTTVTAAKTTGVQLYRLSKPTFSRR